MNSREIEKLKDALSAFGGEFTFGSRLRYIRSLRQITQKRLGIVCGFPENDAAKRIRQYENGERYPKEQLIRVISEELRISPQMLTLKSTDVQATLFISVLWADIFNDINIFPATKDYTFLNDNINMIDTRVESNVPGIVANSESPIYGWLESLCHKYSQYEKGIISFDALRDWELSWKP